EKLIIDAVLEMAETGTVLSCKDLGAAGLAGASSEMCSTFGAEIHADRVRQRETGMSPPEIMLSESQERMLIETRARDVPALARIAEKYDLTWSEIGKVIPEPRYRVLFHGQVACDLPIRLLTHGAPLCQWETKPRLVTRPYARPSADLKTLAAQVLSHPEVAGREWITEQYDHDVQLRSVSLTGDTAVLRLDGAALVLSCGCNPRQIAIRPYEGTANSLYENAANLAGAGADPLCIVNCLNFASPVHPEICWELEECIRGLGDMARRMGVPVVGGNVSLYNESDEFGTQIPPTPSIGLVGKGQVRTWQRAPDGSLLALVGETRPEFGGSVLDAVTGCGGDAPAIPDIAVLGRIRDLVDAGSCLVATDLSQGGLLAALAALTPGARITLEGDPVTALFSESYGRFLVAIREGSRLAGIPHRILGEAGGDGLRITAGKERLVLTGEELQRYDGAVTALMRD
ncbi:MAG: AIR synthase related protein, partial [Methanomicrobiales archaeon]|nr:AIR synthase related protein [Methanomicrobiales archaeon]